MIDYTSMRSDSTCYFYFTNSWQARFFAAGIEIYNSPRESIKLQPGAKATVLRPGVVKVKGYFNIYKHKLLND